MDRYSKLEPEVRTRCASFIDQRWAQLYELRKTAAERAVRYLLLTNSGGAIATLSFLGAYEGELDASSIRNALSLFGAGVILVGLSGFWQFHSISRMFAAWRSAVDKYFNDKISWDQLNSEDIKRSATTFWDYFFPYLSFGCFIAGCIVGGLALFSP